MVLAMVKGLFAHSKAKKNGARVGGHSATCVEKTRCAYRDSHEQPETKQSNLREDGLAATQAHDHFRSAELRAGISEVYIP